MGPVSVPGATIAITGSPSVNVGGNINLGAGGVLDITGNVVIEPGTVINMAQCPAPLNAPTNLITATGTTTGTPSLTCPGYTGTTEIDGTGKLVIKGFSANPVLAIPATGPLGLAFTGALLAFLGRKGIQKALGK